MAATPVTRIFDGTTVTSTPLPPMRALDLVSELSGPLQGLKSNSEIQSALLFALTSLNFRQLLPKLLVSTTITVADGGAPMKINLNTTEAIDLAFDGRMGIFLEVVAFALEVTYKDFFAGAARIGKSIQMLAP